MERWAHRDLHDVLISQRGRRFAMGSDWQVNYGTRRKNSYSRWLNILPRTTYVVSVANPGRHKTMPVDDVFTEITR